MNNTSTQSEDAVLVYELIESMYAGIALMKQGQTKAVNEQVRTLAKKLESEHTTLTNNLEQLARKKGWDVPTSAAQKDEDKLEDMEEKDGESYDKKWLKLLRKRHKTNIGKIEDSQTDDPAMQAMAAEGLPKLRALQNNIETVENSL